MEPCLSSGSSFLQEIGSGTTQRVSIWRRMSLFFGTRRPGNDEGVISDWSNRPEEVPIRRSKRESLNRHHEVCLFPLRPEAVQCLQRPSSHWLRYSQSFFRRLLFWRDFVRLQAHYFLSFGCKPWLFGLSFHMKRSFHARRRLRSNWPQLPWFRRLLSVGFYPENSANTLYYYIINLQASKGFKRV